MVNCYFGLENNYNASITSMHITHYAGTMHQVFRYM